MQCLESMSRKLYQIYYIMNNIDDYKQDSAVHCEERLMNRPIIDKEVGQQERLPAFTKTQSAVPSQHLGYASQKNKLAYGNTLVPNFNAPVCSSGDQNKNQLQFLNKQKTEHSAGGAKYGLINQDD